jgi:hypothetical protein
MDMYKCNNYNNLQLLTVDENAAKSDSFTAAEAAAYVVSIGGMAIAELLQGWIDGGVCQCGGCVVDVV